RATRKKSAGACSEGFEIFEQLIFLLGRKVGAVEVATVAFPAAPRVEEKITLLRFPERTDSLRGRLLETNLYRVVNVVAAVEGLRAFVRRIEEIAQGRDGPVVEIGCAQPKAVERRGKVAGGVNTGHGGGIGAIPLPP